MRYLMTFSYDGSGYHGYQKQINENSIQSEIENALSKINGNNYVRIHATGRTDAGVHALNQKAHFDLEKTIEIFRLKHSLNKILPDDIYIKNIINVPDDFHARFNVKSKEYIYKINLGEYNPLERNYVYQLNEKLDIGKIEIALQLIKGTHNFKSFTKTTNEIDNYVRTIFEASISHDVSNSNIIIISLKGDGFLRYMVRNIVGVLIEIGSGKRNPEDIVTILEAQDRTISGKTAPSCGLYLKNIEY